MIGAHEMTNRAGITYRQLDFWTRCGYLHCLNADEAAHGVPRLYAENQARLAAVMKQLSDIGVAPRQAAPIAARLIAENRAEVGALVISWKEAEVA